MKLRRLIVCLACVALVLPFMIGLTPSLQWGDTPLKTTLPPVVITGQSTYKVLESRRIPVPSPFLPGGKERPVIIASPAQETVVPESNKQQPTPQTPGCAYHSSITTRVATLFKGAEAYEKRGKYLFLNHRYADAIETFTKLIQSYPESPRVGEAYFWIGESYFRMEDIPHAEENYKVAALRYPSSAYADYALYSLGWIAYKRGAYDKAIDYFKNAIAAYPNSPIYAHMLFWLAESYSRVKKIELADETFKKVLKRTSDPLLKVPATFEIAKIAFIRKEYATAKKILKDLSQQSPPTSLVPKIDLLTGWCEYFLKDARALGSFGQAFHAAGTSQKLKAEARYGQALSAIQQGKAKIAEKLLQAMRPASPWYGETAVALAQYYFNKKDYQRAGKTCAKIFENAAKSPYLEHAYMIMGNIAYNTKRYADATEYYTHVIVGKADRLKPMAIFAKGLAFYQIGQFRDAIDSWEEVLKRYPNFLRNRETLYWLGSAYLNLHQERLAATYFARLKQSPNDYAKALIQMSEYWFGQQRWKKALEVLKRYLALFPRGPYAGFARGMTGEIYFNLKDDKKAAKWLREAIQDINVRRNLEYRAKITFILGKVYYRMGAFNRAIGYFKTVASRFSKNSFSDDAQYWQALSYYSQQAYKPAIQSFERLLRDFPQSPLKAKAMMKIGDCFYNLKDYDRSQAYYRKVASLFRKDRKIRENAAYGVILSLYQKKDYKRFFAEASAFMTRFPDSPLSLDVVQLLSEYYERQGNLDQEIDLLDSYLRAHKNIPHADAIRLNLARLFIQKGLYDSAMVQLRIVSRSPSHTPFKSVAEREMGNLYFKQKMYSQAIIHYQKYLRAEKQPVDIVRHVRKQLVLAYLRSGNLKRAQQELDSDSKTFGIGWSAPLYLELGKTYLKKKEYHAALLSFKQASKSSDSLTKCKSLTYVGEVYRRTGKYNKSLKTLLMVRYSYPACRTFSERFLLHLSVTLGKKGKKEEARQLLKVLVKSHDKQVKRLAQRALNRLH